VKPRAKEQSAQGDKENQAMNDEGQVATSREPANQIEEKRAPLAEATLPQELDQQQSPAFFAVLSGIYDQIVDLKISQSQPSQADPSPAHPPSSHDLPQK